MADERRDAVAGERERADERDARRHLRGRGGVSVGGPVRRGGGGREQQVGDRGRVERRVQRACRDDVARKESGCVNRKRCNCQVERRVPCAPGSATAPPRWRSRSSSTASSAKRAAPLAIVIPERGGAAIPREWCGGEILTLSVKHLGTRRVSEVVKRRSGAKIILTLGIK